MGFVPRGALCQRCICLPITSKVAELIPRHNLPQFASFRSIPKPQIHQGRRGQTPTAMGFGELPGASCRSSPVKQGRRRSES
jgi:hypothetical protein